MATTFFSQHSSNPLEVSSSDARNNAALSMYKRAKDDAGIDRDSDDPIGGYDDAEIEGYQSHLAQLFPNHASMQARRTRGEPEQLIDLDEDMQSDDELEKDGMDGSEASDDDSDVDGDADGEVDEEMSLYLKPREEQEEIEAEIAELECAVPMLNDDYKLVDRLGTGTFSSVYKAIDKGYHTKWHNSVWHGSHPPSSSAFYQSVRPPPGSKVFVAIKRIYVTSSPERIRNEITIMETCRGARHVSQIITAFRDEDQVVAVMPFHRNEDFRAFYRTLPVEGVKLYFRSMFRALRDIHSRGIIHRDVKPANFLFDPQTGVGTLVDLGLACRMDSASSPHQCLHTPATKEHPHGHIRRRSEFNTEKIKEKQKEARMRSLWPSDRVGFPAQDARPNSKANRAGTRGFRAPEVLLRCTDQTGAVDVWSAGMILLFFLTGKFPLFQSGDDVEALLEIACIIGKQKMEKTATLHNRTFTTNIPSVKERTPWRSFVTDQNPDIFTPPLPDRRFYPYNIASSARHHGSSHAPPDSSSSSYRTSPSSSDSRSRSSSSAVPTPESYREDMENALDLLEKLMEPESTQRCTPRDALYHPFLFDETQDGEDDDYFPHPFGEGVCGDLHFVDPVTEELCVRVRSGDEKEGEIVRKITAGEGVAIGREPCEFHREDVSVRHMQLSTSY
ncbi:kinase-like protein [Artomyces pyxidatus]|uniref:Kinase-like protein n=1 Tax=Artomyces pyxidatus TaxID=48021 RepID=A0ACB8TC29_9AGAM|nr:kinase-like protein [Artomyces pyxidatus]